MILTLKSMKLTLKSMKLTSFWDPGHWVDPATPRVHLTVNSAVGLIADAKVIYPYPRPYEPRLTRHVYPILGPGVYPY